MRRVLWASLILFVTGVNAIYFADRGSRDDWSRIYVVLALLLVTWIVTMTLRSFQATRVLLIVAYATGGAVALAIGYLCLTLDFAAPLRLVLLVVAELILASNLRSNDALFERHSEAR